VVIVSVTRSDLRDEIAMANEAFALSPISARAAQPNEADYDAIREAFMETARGRWFLGEYAKRNRNADTSMVLDAVARIEETLAAQRQPVVEDRLPEALVAIRGAIAEAEAAAGAAFDRAALEASLGPINRGIRIIKEISWRWREIGADGRICDLIDSQLTAIEGACAQIAAIDPRAELESAFDLLKDRIEQAGGGEALAPHAAAAGSVHPAPAPEPESSNAPEASPVETTQVASQGPAAMAEMPQEMIAVAEEGATNALSDVVEVIDVAEAASAPDVAGAADVAEAEERRSSLEDALTEAVAPAEMVEDLPLDAAAEAEDEAILDIVALEMAASDPEFDEMAAEPAAAETSEPPPGLPHAEEPVAAAPIAPASEVVATSEIGIAVMERPAPEMAQTTPLPMPSPLPEPSLGATILASGMLQKPRTAANDPLASIRRMTQAEKIAFFS
jgi:hypothetical protein